MSQTEIAGGKLTSDGEVPSRGRRLREFELVSSEGKPVRLSDYRGRSNLVVILTDERPEVQELLAALRSQCLGCAIRRPFRSSPAYAREKPIGFAIATNDIDARRGWILFA